MMELVRSCPLSSLPALLRHWLNRTLFRRAGRGLWPQVPLRLRWGIITLSPEGNDGLHFWLEVDRTGAYDILAKPVALGHWLVDCGANTGAVCVRYLRGVAGARGVALEPHPGSYQRLCRNLAANGLAHAVLAFNQAVGEADGSLPFTLSEGSSMGFVAGEGLDVALGRRTHGAVRAVRLDTLLENLPGPPAKIALKIDVEGYELHVLRGATRSLARTSHVVIETHSAALLAGCSELLRACGFELRIRGPMLYGEQPALMDGDAGRAL